MPMLFLVWYDEDPKKPVSEKIAAAVAAYRVRFNNAPGLVLVNARDYVDVAGLLVRSERTVQPNTFWVGREAEIADVGAAVAP
jgi:hypothetical protein